MAPQRVLKTLVTLRVNGSMPSISSKIVGTQVGSWNGLLNRRISLRDHGSMPLPTAKSNGLMVYMGITVALQASELGSIPSRSTKLRFLSSIGEHPLDKRQTVGQIHQELPTFLAIVYWVENGSLSRTRAEIVAPLRDQNTPH